MSIGDSFPSIITYSPPGFKEKYGDYGQYILSKLRKDESVNIDSHSATMSSDGFANGMRWIKNTRQTKVLAVAFHIPKHDTKEIHHYDLTVYRYSRTKYSDPLDWSIVETYSLRDKEVTELNMFMNEQSELVGKPMQDQHATVVYTHGAATKQLLQEVAKVVEDDKTGEEANKLIDTIVEAHSDGSLLMLGFTPSQIDKRRKELDELEAIIDNPDSKEVSDIQAKLKSMPWVFGPEYAKYSDKKAGDDIPDGRLKRVDGLSDILEVKLPSEEVLRADERGRTYIAPKCAEYLGQLISYLEYYQSKYETQFDDDSGEEILEAFDQGYYKPKGTLLIGRRDKSKVVNLTKRTSNAHPKYMRRQLSYYHGVEIVTYDDLLERARNSLDAIEGKKI